MTTIEIKRNPRIHAMSGGTVEEYVIKYFSDFIIRGEVIENIKSNKLTIEEKKIFKKHAKVIGSEIINGLIEHIVNEEVE